MKKKSYFHWNLVRNFERKDIYIWMSLHSYLSLIKLKLMQEVVNMYFAITLLRTEFLLKFGNLKSILYTWFHHIYFQIMFLWNAIWWVKALKIVHNVSLLHPGLYIASQSQIEMNWKTIFYLTIESKLGTLNGNLN